MQPVAVGGVTVTPIGSSPNLLTQMFGGFNGRDANFKHVYVTGQKTFDSLKETARYRAVFGSGSCQQC